MLRHYVTQCLQFVNFTHCKQCSEFANDEMKSTKQWNKWKSLSRKCNKKCCMEDGGHFFHVPMCWITPEFLYWNKPMWISLMSYCAINVHWRRVGRLPLGGNCLGSCHLITRSSYTAHSWYGFVTTDITMTLREYHSVSNHRQLEC